MRTAARLGVLTVTMLRYRAALMVWMFLLLGAAYPHGRLNFDTSLLWALIALAASYVCATTINDLADVDIDRVNHPHDPARPLVGGRASARDLWIVNAATAAIALGFGALIGPRGLALIALGLVVAYAYSAPPLKLSHRTYAAPLLLAVGYVVVPCLLGSAVQDEAASDGPLLVALVLLFLARIVLKDFRDRAGDARFGRPTLLLQHGKRATCAVSLGALVAGDVALVVAIGSVAVAALVQVFVAGIAHMLFTLERSSDAREEQVAIGIGARLGNGLLVSVLAWLLLQGSEAPFQQRIGFLALLAALYGINFFVLRTRPHEVLIGYKG